MRRFVFVLVMVACLAMASFAYAPLPSLQYGDPWEARTKESWGDIVVPDNTVFGVRFVLDSAKLGGISYAERLEIDPEVETEFSSMVNRCVAAGNKLFQKGATTRASSFHFSPKFDGKKYTISFYVKDVSEYGYTVSDVIFSADGKIASILNLKGKGGRFGSFANLMGDGFESLGQKLAESMDYAVFRGFIKEK